MHSLLSTPKPQALPSKAPLSKWRVKACTNVDENSTAIREEEQGVRRPGVVQPGVCERKRKSERRGQCSGAEKEWAVHTGGLEKVLPGEQVQGSSQAGRTEMTYNLTLCFYCEPPHIVLGKWLSS